MLEPHSAIEAYRDLYNRVHPHETLGQTPPIGHYLAEPTRQPNLSEPESVQES